MEDLRWEEDLCLSFLSGLSCLEDSFFSRLLSGLFSRILEGMTGDSHDAAQSMDLERLFCGSHLPDKGREGLRHAVGACAQVVSAGRRPAGSGRCTARHTRLTREVQ